MSQFKCKMCGGALEIGAGKTVVTCEYCGTQQTLPKLDDEKRANMYDRANHFRRNNEFDKAMGIYEQILNEDKTDAEAYWSLVLCRYGIEYVEDPSSHKRIPTINRAQFTSVFDDDNYKSALEYADALQKSVYEEEAKAINEIQKGILAISQKEEPFDVFICYKESDNNGRRTPDSVLANDLYHQLSQEGFKVFFARITLEDKLGSAYEPYIFAALNSSKVMVVLGTKPEFFNAVWVKNEWSRYLALIKNGEKKMLIPAYKDMDPYDLPEEFSHLQAQDMSKLGFMQDLIRGIKKIVESSEPKAATVVKETVVTTSANADTAPLLKRAFMFLEDSDWKSADEYCEKVLDIDPECADAYLGKLMAELRVNRKEHLKNCAEPFEDRNNYQKTIRFGDDTMKKELEACIAFIYERNENARLEGIYNAATDMMNDAETEKDYLDAAEEFLIIPEYKNSKELADKCKENAEVARKDAILGEAEWYISNFDSELIDYYEDAISLLKKIPGWKDADELIIKCDQKIEEIRARLKEARLEKERKDAEAKAEAERIAKRNKKIAIITTPIVCALIAFWILWVNVIVPNMEYNKALSLMEAEKYEEAISAFKAMDGYKDSVNKIAECETGILDNKYDYAVALTEAGKYEEAFEVFKIIDGYKDSKEKVESLKLKAANVGDYVFLGAYEQDNSTSNGKEDIEWLVLEKQENKILIISKYALDCKPYNTEYKSVTWETCFLRKWLNNDFINSAFSDDEKAIIPTVTVSADKNPNYSTNPGNATQDKVFLLSITEANKYFSSDGERQCEASDYVVANGAYVNSSNGNCWWWMRSPGFYQGSVAGVDDGGSVYEFGYGVNGDSRAVRPAMWIDTSLITE